MIINGAMQIAQRGTSFTGTNNYAVDRWKNAENTDGVTTISRQSDGPYTVDGHFKYYLQVNVDTPDTSLAATQYAGVFYKVEGYDFDPAGYGSSQAKTLTLSFWHCHSVAGIYSVSMRNDGGGSNRNFVFDYTQDVAGVWQKTIITFPGDTVGTWTETNTAALSMIFTFAQGTQYATSTLNQWFGGTYYHASTNIDNMMATTNAKFRLTGVQLELGNIATPFEHRSYGEELALCQRYYQKQIYDSGEMVGVVTIWDTNDMYGRLYFPVEFRAAPTFSHNGVSAFSWYSAGNNAAVSDIFFYDINTQTVKVRWQVGTGRTPGDSAWIQSTANGNFIAADAEL
jgi:hypothetical protein